MQGSIDVIRNVFPGRIDFFSLIREERNTTSNEEMALTGGRSALKRGDGFSLIRRQSR